MFDILYSFGAFIVALGVLVTVHEWGHFYAARKLGVKVLTFSVGFGRAIFKWKGKDGVEYRVAYLPLGGYVKMLGETEFDQLPAGKEDESFINQANWKRSVILFAGPLANFVLALVLYWFTFILGVNSSKPVTGAIPQNSIAAEAGLSSNLEIQSITNSSVVDWQDVIWALAEQMGKTEAIHIKARSIETQEIQSYRLDTQNWLVDDRKPDVLGSLGLTPFNWRDASLPAVIFYIAEGGGADKAGLKIKDKIIQMDSTSINSYLDIQNFMSERTSTASIIVKVEREGIEQELFITPKREGERYLIGVGPYNPGITKQYGPVEAVNQALIATWKTIRLTGIMFKKILTGEISTKALGGPISIAEGAGSSARIGLVYFISFLAMISINLGVINLLPIPMLDGGQLLFNACEAVKGKPLSDKTKDMGTRVGILLVFSMMAFAIFNDIARLW